MNEMHGNRHVAREGFGLSGQALNTEPERGPALLFGAVAATGAVMAGVVALNAGVGVARSLAAAELAIVILTAAVFFRELLRQRAPQPLHGESALAGSAMPGARRLAPAASHRTVRREPSVPHAPRRRAISRAHAL